MKIYELQYHDGEKEWIAANTVIEALQVTTSISDMNISDYDEKTDIVEVPESEWENRIIFDVEYPEDKDLQRTFKQWMEDNSKPDIIASTIY